MCHDRHELAGSGLSTLQLRARCFEQVRQLTPRYPLYGLLTLTLTLTALLIEVV